MKTQRRHELQTNALADWLGNQIEAIKPYWQIIVGVLLGVVILAMFIIFMNMPKAGNSGPWTDLFNAVQQPNAEQALEKVESKDRGTLVGWWAKLAAADIELQQGLGFLYRDHEQARKVLEEARKDYENVAKNAPQAMMRQRGLWGAAKTYEALAATVKDDNELKRTQTSDLNKAAEYYAKLVDEAKGTAVGLEAKHCLDRLVDSDGTLRPSVMSLYEDLVAYKPPEQISSMLDESDLPEVPDLSFPGEESSAAPESSTSPEPSTSAEPSTPPEPSTPAESSTSGESSPTPKSSAPPAPPAPDAKEKDEG